MKGRRSASTAAGHHSLMGARERQASCACAVSKPAPSSSKGTYSAELVPSRRARVGGALVVYWNSAGAGASWKGVASKLRPSWDEEAERLKASLPVLVLPVIPAWPLTVRMAKSIGENLHIG
ncbi:unnamed protein product [Symbiodinium sp. CCMP2592]|nr:unnamed protein product [Symbiodinium sp. CCMP2592]